MPCIHIRHAHDLSSPALYKYYSSLLSFDSSLEELEEQSSEEQQQLEVSMKIINVPASLRLFRSEVASVTGMTKLKGGDFMAKSNTSMTKFKGGDFMAKSNRGVSCGRDNTGYKVFTPLASLEHGPHGLM